MTDGELDASYRHTDVDTDIELADADFRLAEGQPASAVLDGISPELERDMHDAA